MLKTFLRINIIDNNEKIFIAPFITECLSDIVDSLQSSKNIPKNSIFLSSNNEPFPMQKKFIEFSEKPIIVNVKLPEECQRIMNDQKQKNLQTKQDIVEEIRENISLDKIGNKQTPFDDTNYFSDFEAPTLIPIENTKNSLFEAMKGGDVCSEKKTADLNQTFSLKQVSSPMIPDRKNFEIKEEGSQKENSNSYEIDPSLESLLELGFDETKSKDALLKCQGNVTAAVNYILTGTLPFGINRPLYNQQNQKRTEDDLDQAINEALKSFTNSELEVIERFCNRGFSRTLVLQTYDACGHDEATTESILLSM